MHTKRNWLIRLIVFITGLVSILLVTLVISAYYKNQQPTTYRVKFYEQNKKIVEIVKDKNERISDKEISEINRLVSNVDNKYYLSWSTTKDEYQEAKFSEINKNQNVYLFRFKNTLDINVVETNLFKYELSLEGPLKRGDSFTMKVTPINEAKDLQPYLLVNGERLNASVDGLFHIEDVKKDLTIEVDFLHTAKIIVEEQEFTYTGYDQKISFNLIDDLGNILPKYSCKVTYLYDGKACKELVDAGVYTVTIEYQEDSYYVKPVTFQVKVKKAEPKLAIFNKEFEFNGETQSLTKEDIITESDGEIEFTNNQFKERGLHYIEVTVKESKNYLSKTITAEILVKKGKPEIIENPEASLGFSGATLASIKLNGGKTSVPGNFEFVHPNKNLIDGINQYEVIFVPTDARNYVKVKFNISVNTLSNEEMLRRVQADRVSAQNEIQKLQEKTINLNDPEFKDFHLLTEGKEYGSEITWISTSSVLQITSDGTIQLNGPAGTYQVEVVGYFILGNAVEYLTFSITIVINE